MWYRVISNVNGTAFDIWDYGHEIEQIPAEQLQRSLGLYDPSGNKKGYFSGIIHDDISYLAKGEETVYLPNKQKTTGKRLLIMQYTTHEAQRQIEKYFKTTVEQPKIFSVILEDEKNGVVYQIFAGSRVEAEGIKEIYTNYGIDSIIFTKDKVNYSITGSKYIALQFGESALIALLILSAAVTAIMITYFITDMMKSYYHMVEVQTYYETEQKLAQQKIEALKLQGKVLDFKSLAGVEETDCCYIYHYNDGTIVTVDKKTGKIISTHGSNMSEKDWDEWWRNLEENQKPPTPPMPPSYMTEMLKWIAIIAGISIGGLLLYKYVSSGKASEHTKKAKETINVFIGKIKEATKRKQTATKPSGG